MNDWFLAPHNLPHMVLFFCIAQESSWLAEVPFDSWETSEAFLDFGISKHFRPPRQLKVMLHITLFGNITICWIPLHVLSKTCLCSANWGHPWLAVSAVHWFGDGYLRKPELGRGWAKRTKSAVPGVSKLKCWVGSFSSTLWSPKFLVLMLSNLGRSQPMS